MRRSGFERVLEEYHGQVFGLRLLLSRREQLHVKVMPDGPVEAEIEPPPEYPFAHINRKHSYSAHRQVGRILRGCGIRFRTTRTVPRTCLRPIIDRPDNPSHWTAIALWIGAGAVAWLLGRMMAGGGRRGPPAAHGAGVAVASRRRGRADPAVPRISAARTSGGNTPILLTEAYRAAEDTILSPAALDGRGRVWARATLCEQELPQRPRTINTTPLILFKDNLISEAGRTQLRMETVMLDIMTGLDALATAILYRIVQDMARALLSKARRRRDESDGAKARAHMQHADGDMRPGAGNALPATGNTPASNTGAGQKPRGGGAVRRGSAPPGRAAGRNLSFLANWSFSLQSRVCSASARFHVAFGIDPGRTAGRHG